MPSLEQLGRQLASLQELQSVVHTMKVLSAASIRQYEQAVQALGDYERTVELGLHVVLRERQRPPEATLVQGQRPLAAIVFGSDHGLCGRFNEDLTSYVEERLRPHMVAGRPLWLLVVGARLAARLEQAGLPVQADFLVPGSATRIAASVQQILLKVDEWRTDHGVEQVQVFYNRHHAGAQLRPLGRTLLPVNLRRLHRLEEAPWPSQVLPTFSMEREQLFAALLRQYFFVILFRACAESLASEHASRLAAMRSAEANLQERSQDLGRSFRQARQGQITAELLDVVAGYEALMAGGAEQSSA